MRDVICNTSPLQYLYQIGFLHLLPTLFGRIQVPTHIPDSVRPMLDRLQELRFRLSAGIRQAVLDAADERD